MPCVRPLNEWFHESLVLWGFERQRGYARLCCCLAQHSNTSFPRWTPSADAAFMQQGYWRHYKLAPNRKQARTKTTGMTTENAGMEDDLQRTLCASSCPSASYQFQNNMCPMGLMLHHPAVETLLDYASAGCPKNMGSPWTHAQMQAAIDCGPHVSGLVPAAIEQLDLEVNEKVANGQARIIRWNDICHSLPPQLKISPVAMVPHKSRLY